MGEIRQATGSPCAELEAHRRPDEKQRRRLYKKSSSQHHSAPPRAAEISAARAASHKNGSAKPEKKSHGRGRARRPLDHHLPARTLSVRPRGAVCALLEDAKFDADALKEEGPEATCVLEATRCSHERRD